MSTNLPDQYECPDNIHFSMRCVESKMGMFLNIIIIAALLSFVLYNMDMVNKLGHDVKMIRTLIEEGKDNDGNQNLHISK